MSTSENITRRTALAFVLFAASMCLPRLLPAQEYLQPWNSAPLQTPVRPMVKTLADVLELPFFDDFSDYCGVPDPARWADNYVFINQTFAISPPSLGVASFDLTDNQGYIHPIATQLSEFSSDTLTSRPLNLNFPGDLTTFMSFAYQPGGYGDLPEPADSLILEFYAPTLEIWKTVWAASADTSGNVVEYFTDKTRIWTPASAMEKEFRKVLVYVASDDFLQSGFRFRFRNLGSLQSFSTQPSLLGNADLWNIDYVYLNRNRTLIDTVHKDLAMITPLASMLDGYEALPWNHYNASGGGRIKNKFTVDIKNNDSQIRYVDSLNVLITDLRGNGASLLLEGGSLAEFEPGEQRRITYPANGIRFQSDVTDSAVFDIKVYLRTDVFDSAINNEVHYRQIFDTYYAYDDGTPEAGYGITGQGSRSALLAYRFVPLAADTLTAVSMLFNHIKGDLSQGYYFILTIWDNADGQPGTAIYTQKGTKPSWNDEYNSFFTFELDTPQLVSDTFYVGWTQTREASLNVGFDMQRDTRKHLFYNVDGNWRNSAYAGALMVRPVFDDASTKSALMPGNPKNEGNMAFNIFPNPASDFLSVSWQDVELEQVDLYLSDISGRRHLTQTDYMIGQTVDVSSLSKGMYLVVVAQKGVILGREKLIIVR